jgi:tetratricopeptide (TPR) repeat protein
VARKSQPARRLPPHTTPPRAWWIAAGLVMLTFAVYAAVAHFEFVTWDDGNYIHIDPVRSGLTWRGVTWAFTTGETANWHPLTWISHMLDVEMYGDRAGGHHVTNLILHVANVLLLFGVFVRMTGAIGRSAFVAALFAVHPLHVESVAWVAERKDVLSTFFALLTIWTYVTYVREPRATRFLVVCLCYALGLMAKPMLVTLPFVLLLVDVWPLGRVRPGGGNTWRSLAIEKLPLVGLAIASSITTVVLQRQAGAMGDGASDAFPIGLRIGNAIVSYAAYLGQTVWPAGLSPFYPYPRAVPAVAVVISLLVLAGLSFAAVRAARQRPYVLVGWLWYVGMLVPVIGLIQVGQQSRADRYTYLPLVGIFFIVAWGVPELVARWKLPRAVLPALACVVVLASAATAWFQVETWRDSFALWTHALEVTPDNDRAYNGLGAELGNRGKIDEAIGKFREAIRINPSFADAHVNLAVAFGVQGKFVEAIPHYAEALRLQPGHREGRNHYAEALEGVGRLDEAAQQYQISLLMDPNQGDVHAGLGLVLAQQGKLAEALDAERTAVRLAPTSVKAHYGLGAVLAVNHQVEEAVREFNEVLRLDPGNQAAKQALAQLKVGKS